MQGFSWQLRVCYTLGAGVTPKWGKLVDQVQLHFPPGNARYHGDFILQWLQQHLLLYRLCYHYKSERRTHQQVEETIIFKVQVVFTFTHDTAIIKL